MVGRTLAVLLVSIGVLGATASASPAKPRKRGPVDAKVTLDRTRAASVPITVAVGGSIALKAPNGTKVTIRFPAGAVEEDTLVTATLVKRLASRVTRTGMLAGVQLAPDGLLLRKAATVRFSRRGKRRKGTQLVFVGSHGDGKDLYRLPPPVRTAGQGKTRRYVTTGSPVVSILHFSTVNAFDWSTATLGDIDAILYPEVGIDRVSQRLAQLLRDKNATEADLLAVFDEERKRFIDPLVALASQRLTKSCSLPAIRGAVVTVRIALSFERGMQLMGLSKGFSDPAVGTLMTKTGNCMATLCPSTGDPRAAGYFVGLARQLALVGGASEAFLDALVENMRRCGVYELSIDSRIDTSGPDGNLSWQVAGKVTVTPSLTGAEQPHARGALTHVAFTGATTAFCAVTAVSRTTPGEFELDDLQFTPFDPENPTEDPVASVRIKITTPPSETYHSTLTGGKNCGTQPPPDYELPWWYTGFLAEHPDFTFPGSDFVRAAPPVAALAVYSPRTIDLGNGSLSENTKIEIIHTPEPPVPLPDPDPKPAR
jgi:hypothetical protein